MAEINLLPEKNFEITLKSGEVIKGMFGTWALKRFCDKHKISLLEVRSQLQSVGGIVDYLLCSVEYIKRLSGEQFSFTDIHACQWIDEMGGIGSEKFLTLTKHSEDEAPAEEKKTETELPS